MVTSNTFPAGITIRFPRFIKLRSDEKSVDEAMTLEELRAYFNEKGGSMQKRLNDGDEEIAIVKKRKIGRCRAAIPESFKEWTRLKFRLTPNY